jgi:hypothetical protein
MLLLAETHMQNMGQQDGYAFSMSYGRPHRLLVKRRVRHVIANHIGAS